jgi:hypothetical protein
MNLDKNSPLGLLDDADKTNKNIFEILRRQVPMSISAISSSSVAAAYTPPPVQQPQQAKAPLKVPTTDTVTISKQAQQLASDGDPAALEAQESSAERTSEASKGKV